MIASVVGRGNRCFSVLSRNNNCESREFVNVCFAWFCVTLSRKEPTTKRIRDEEVLVLLPLLLPVGTGFGVCDPLLSPLNAFDVIGFRSQPRAERWRGRINKSREAGGNQNRKKLFLFVSTNGNEQWHSDSF